MAEQLTLQFQSRMDSVASASDAVSRWLAERAASEEVQYFARFAVEELATNCIKYGYDDMNEHTLEVSLSLSEDGFVLTFADDGRAFNPLLVPDPDFSPTLEDRRIGGWGLYLLRQMSRDMQYVRLDGKNIVTLHKGLDGV